MKKYITTLIAIATNLLACNNNHAQVPPASRTDKSLLWRVSNKDMNRSSYLFGTIHMICKEDYIWTPAMAQALKSCKEVCFEMDMDDPSLLMQTAAGMIDNSGKKLIDYFTAEQYQKLSRYLADSLSMNIDMFQQMKPAALQTVLSLKDVQCAAPESYETNIMEESKKQKKEITGLEEASEQLALFDDMPVDSVVKDILESIDDHASETKEYNDMVAAYKKQDLPALYRMITESKELGDQLDAFLDKRNQKWIERMVDKMDQNSVFFAVGAGHLWGDNGVITLLRKAGYTVTPVK